VWPRRNSGSLFLLNGGESAYPEAANKSSAWPPARALYACVPTDEIASDRQTGLQTSQATWQTGQLRRDPLVPSKPVRGVGFKKGHKPALKFSSRRASAFQRPWTAPRSSNGVRARKHPRNPRVGQPFGDHVALHGSQVVPRRPRSPRRLPVHDSGARIDSGARWSRCPRRGRQRSQAAW
jgi:hypothetical protein